MLRRILPLATLLAPLLLSACAETHAYLGAEYERSLAQAPPAAARPVPVRVVTEFRVNEESSEGANKVLRREVKRVLEDSGVYQPAESAELVLRVTVDDRADIAEAHKSGFLSGLTLGHSDGGTEDRYDFALSLESPRGLVRSERYQPVLTTTSLRQVPASYGPPHSAEDAFNIIVRNTVLRFIAGSGG